MQKSVKRIFASTYAEHLTRFIALQQQLGYKYESQSSVLYQFDQWLCERNASGPLTLELALAFATNNSAMSKSWCSSRYQTVRNFSEYLTIFMPDTPQLPCDALTSHRVRPPAHIYSDAELTRLLRAAQNVSRLNPLRGTTLHAMVGLAAATGMRCIEIVQLDRSDVNLETGILSIRQSKFRKDRLVPIHPTTRQVLRDYAVVRDAYFATDTIPAFFINQWRKRFSRHTLGLSFYFLACQVGLREQTGRGPHFHDLRHTFAVRRLVAWYREGRDVQAMLPLLATYMGHVHYSETAYYLSATSELLGLASERYHHFLQSVGEA